ncbi:unnamed protein product [Ilex paraguariensis]|uniref:DUF4283 domain-containing protein n=1 Tax=Ilex paraguariensis TaxID=185542 RepID=A0ABC8R914_9AQUA
MKKICGLLDATMDEKLQQLWRTFNLTEEGSSSISIINEGDGALGKKGRLCVFGKVLSMKLYNKAACKSIMRMVWNNVKVEIIEAGNNLFLIQFNNVLDKNKILEGLS